MILDVGIGVGEYHEFTPKLRGDVEVDRFLPVQKIANFVQADLEHLPFKDKAFQLAFAYNVLEHIQNPGDGIKELKRVSLSTDCRQDQWFHIGNYASSSHLYFQLPGLRFLRYPETRVGRLFQKWLWFTLTHPISWGNGKRGPRQFRIGGLICHTEKPGWRQGLVYHARVHS